LLGGFDLREVLDADLYPRIRAGPEKIGKRDRHYQADDRNYDHKFEDSETPKSANGLVYGPFHNEQTIGRRFLAKLTYLNPEGADFVTRNPRFFDGIEQPQSAVGESPKNA